jgi:hypothetical protein
MTIVAWALLAVGAIVSLAILIGDWRKLRSDEPYAATGLWAPEIHVVIALFTGAGAWMLGGWIVGVAVGVGHAAIGLFAGIWIRR